MPCYYPLSGYYGRKTNPTTGKRPVVFNSREGFYDRPVSLSCGRCIGCRLERSRQWATRCVHEASLYSENCFITLTFKNACPIANISGKRYVRLPYKIDPTESLHKRHFQDFMKRLRKRFYGKSKGNVRYFHCGEYGETLGRPHHHACLFNFDFPDKILYKQKDGIRLYESKILEELWPYGSCKIGDVTFESAAYVARYVIKKITGDPAKNHYNGKLPEYCTMSRRPGLGKNWMEKYSDDVFPKDFIVIRGKKSKVPKYYNSNYELTNPSEYLNVKSLRIFNNRGNPNNHPDRMRAGETITKAKMALLPRTLTSGE